MYYQPDTLISLRLSSALLRRLDTRAKRAGQTRSEYLRRMIESAVLPENLRRAAREDKRECAGS